MRSLPWSRFPGCVSVLGPGPYVPVLLLHALRALLRPWKRLDKTPEQGSFDGHAGDTLNAKFDSIQISQQI